MTGSNLKLIPDQLTGAAVRDLDPAPLPNAAWYLAEAIDDGLSYLFPVGALTGFNYLTADTLLDGNHLAVFLILLQEGETGPEMENNKQPYPDWALGPLEKLDKANPVFGPGDGVFTCPFLGPVKWEDVGICNPAAVVRNDKLYLIYRATGNAGFERGISRLGLAWSDDGIHFERHPGPVLYPDKGPWRDLEFGTGLQDPRIVETENGRYVLTYALFDLKNCYLMVASSDDLVHWQKHGLAFEGKYSQVWSKAGAIVCRREGSRMIATKINGKYWMYWGESEICAATSDDLIHWSPVEIEVEAKKGLYLDEKKVWREKWTRGRMVLRTVLAPRPGRFDGALVEPGPQAILTGRGILLIYNGCNAGDPELPPDAYTAGQVLFDPIDPTAVLGRSEHPFLVPDRPFEFEGEIENVCFANGLAYFRDRWLVYYGAADKFIGVCSTNP